MKSILYSLAYSILEMTATEFDLSTQGGRIAFALHSAGHDSPSAAKELGCSRPAIDQWISGATKNLKSEFLFALEDLTGFSARWIALGKGPRTAHQRSQSIDDIISSAPDQIGAETIDFLEYKLAKHATTLEARQQLSVYSATLEAVRLSIKNDNHDHDQQKNDSTITDRSWLPDPDAPSMNQVTDEKK